MLNSPTEHKAKGSFPCITRLFKPVIREEHTMPKQIYNTVEKYENLYNHLFKGAPFKKGHKTLPLILKINLSDANKATLKEFIDTLSSEPNVSYGRCYKYLIHLGRIIEWLNKDLENVTKEDLIKLAKEINKGAFTENTKKDFRVTVKKLYRTLSIYPKYKDIEPLYFWLYDKRNTFFKAAVNKANDRRKEEWFSPGDVKKILEFARTNEQKCLFSILATQGCRPSEALTLRKQDVTQIENGLKLKIEGKTGVRDVFVYEGIAINYITAHLKTLPNDREYVFEFGLRRAGDILKDCCKRAGITKRAYLYKFRKFCVTQDRIKGLSTAACEEKFGWIKGSQQISCYDKSVSADYQKEIKKRHGLITEKDVKTELEDTFCLRCQEKNFSTNTNCSKCGTKLRITQEELNSILDLERSQAANAELKEEMEKLKQLMASFMQHDKVRTAIEQAK